MTVADLIRTLQDQDPEAYVRIAFQPSHPLTAGVDDVRTLSDCLSREDREDYDEDDLKDVFIVASEAGGYTSGKLWE